MLKIKLRKKGTVSCRKYDIILSTNLEKQNSGCAPVLGYYVPNEKIVNIKKIKFNTALNNGAQVTDVVRHLLNRFLSV